MKPGRETPQSARQPSLLPNVAPAPPFSPVPSIVLQDPSRSATGSIEHQVFRGSAAIPRTGNDSSHSPPLSQARFGPHTDGSTNRADTPGPSVSIPYTVNCSLRIRLKGPEPAPLAFTLSGSSKETYSEVLSMAGDYVKKTFAKQIGQKHLLCRYGNCQIIGGKGYRRRLPLTSYEDWCQICKAVMLYSAENTDSHPRLEILQEYFSHQVGASNLRAAKLGEIHKLMKRAGDKDSGASYVSDTDLKKLLPPDVLSDIIEEDRSPSLDAQRKVNLKAKVLSGGRILFAMWIYHYQNGSMACLNELVESGCNDDKLPLTEADRCHDDEKGCSRNFDDLLHGQGKFCAARFDEPGAHQEIRHGVVIPIQYIPDDDEDDLASGLGLKAGTGKRVANAKEATIKDTAFVGAGAFSRVFRVRLDPNHHALSTDKDTYFALKEFKYRPQKVSMDYEKELMMLTELRKHSHPYIVTHLATWTQDQTYCMLFPYAQCNLWEYMEQTKFNTRRSDKMYWLLEQFLGLGSALKLIHDLSSEASPPNVSSPMLQLPTQAQQGERKTGWHHDIKPENILFFWETDPPRAILRLSDWGCGKVNILRSRSVDTASPNGTLTYEPPEVLMDGTTSRPYDVWSLGCVFMELLVWVFWDFSEVKKFAQSREDRRDLTSTAKLEDDAFWQKAESNSYLHRKSVEERLVGLEKEMQEGGHTSFGAVLKVVTMMLNVGKNERITARDLEDTLSRICRWTKIKLENPTSADPSVPHLSLPQLSLSAPSRREILPSPSAQPFGLGGLGGRTTSPTN